MVPYTYMIVLVLGVMGMATAEHYAVKGVLMCGEQVYKGAVLLLVDNDGASADDEMGANTTNSLGEFEVGGYATDTFGAIDPVLKIYHRCNHPGYLATHPVKSLCKLKYRFRLPGKGKYVAGTTYDFGEYNLMSRPGRTHDFDCNHDAPPNPSK